MKKSAIILSLIMILPALLILFNGCSDVHAETVDAFQENTASPVVTVEVTPMPTQIINLEKFTVKEQLNAQAAIDHGIGKTTAEMKLEKITTTDVTYEGEEEGLDGYLFKNEDASYAVAKSDGHLLLYINESTQEKKGLRIDTKKAKEIARQEISKYRPSFFDYEVEFEIDRGSNKDFYIYLYQISPLGRRTGNLINIDMKRDGWVRSIRIIDQEDPTICDQDYAITKDEAINLAYEACKSEMEELKKAAPNLEVYLDETKHHKVTALLTVRDGIQLWDIGINNVQNNRFEEKDPPEKRPMNMTIQIDANTGEVIVVGYH